MMVVSAPAQRSTAGGMTTDTGGPMCPDSSTRTIPLGHGLSAIVDAEDFEMLSHFKWHAARPKKNQVYARTTSNYSGVSKATKMQRMILLPGPDERVDHINMDTLDNRRCNLRICTNSQNMMNRGKQRNNSSGYKGVYWHRPDRYWRSAVQTKEKYIHCGRFADPVDAALAYDLVALSEYGEFARLNFLRPRKPSEEGPS